METPDFDIIIFLNTSIFSWIELKVYNNNTLALLYSLKILDTQYLYLSYVINKGKK